MIFAKQGEYIYELQITDENVESALNDTLYRLMSKYPRIERDIDGFCLGPNAYKSFEVFCRTRCFIPANYSREVPTWRNYNIYASPIPLIFPVFKQHGWHWAHHEAKEFMKEQVDA
jgi:hypothetical protein